MNPYAATLGREPRVVQALLAAERLPVLRQPLARFQAALRQQGYGANQTGRMFALALVRAPNTETVRSLWAYSGPRPPPAVAALNFVPSAVDTSRQGLIAATHAQQLAEQQARVQALGGESRWLGEPTAVAEARAKALAVFSQRKAQRREQRQACQEDPQALARLAEQSRHDTYQRKATAQRFAALEQQLAEASAIEAQQRIERRAAYTFYDPRGCLFSLAEVPFSAIIDGEVGEGAVIKLLKAAQRQGAEVIGITQFWWGASQGGGVFQHAQHYPPCRGKCLPVLQALWGEALLQRPEPAPIQPPLVLFEDASLLVLDKPSGLRSVPGSGADSALAWAERACGQALYPVHRLDMPTSGVLVLAKRPQAQSALMRAFAASEVEKTYQALTVGRAPSAQGLITLALRGDPNDRPRQRVCAVYGKPSVTRWRRLAHTAQGARLALQPLTGRTHQLRLHLAHAEGLNTPIIGDNLYGFAGERLCLHAESLRFFHPEAQRWLDVHCPVPF